MAGNNNNDFNNNLNSGYFAWNPSYAPCQVKAAANAGTVQVPTLPTPTPAPIAGKVISHRWRDPQPGESENNISQW